EPGEEMTYDYQIQREEDDPPGIEEVFACRCGFPQCRGTMLWPADPPRKRPRRTSRVQPRQPERQPASQRTRQARNDRQRGRDTRRADGAAGKSSRRR
ncbi:MAG: hypothetical protein ACRETR_10750, partial [Steroidobacteraceae bacterium]